MSVSPNSPPSATRLARSPKASGAQGIGVSPSMVTPDTLAPPAATKIQQVSRKRGQQAKRDPEGASPAQGNTQRQQQAETRNEHSHQIHRLNATTCSAVKDHENQGLDRHEYQDQVCQGQVCQDRPIKGRCHALLCSAPVPPRWHRRFACRTVRLPARLSASGVTMKSAPARYSSTTVVHWCVFCRGLWPHRLGVLAAKATK